MTIKQFKYIFTFLVGVVMVLYLGLHLFVSIPSVRHWIAEELSGMLSSSLGSEVRINSVAINLFNSVSVDGLVVYDQKGRKMLYVKRLDAVVDLLPLFEKKCRINNIKVLSGSACLYKATAEAMPNFQFVIDSLAPKPDSRGGAEFSVRTVLVKDFKVNYDVLDQPRSGAKVDMNHLALNRLECSLILKEPDDGKFYARVRNLSFAMPSGLAVDRLKATVSNSGIDKLYVVVIKDFEVSDKENKVRIFDSRLVADLKSLATPSLRWINELDLHAKLAANDGQAYMADLAVENTKSRHKPLHGSLSLACDGKTMLRARFASSDSSISEFDADYALDSEMMQLMPLLELVGVDVAENSVVASIGHVEQRAKIEVTDGRCQTSGSLKSDLCDLSYDLDATDGKADYSLEIRRLDIPAQIQSPGFSLGNSKLRGSVESLDGDLLALHKQSPKSVLSKIKLAMLADMGEVKVAETSLNKVETELAYSPGQLGGKVRFSDPKGEVSANVDARIALGREGKGVTILSSDTTGLLSVGQFARGGFSARLSANVKNLHTSLFGTAIPYVSVFSVDDLEVEFNDSHSFSIFLKDFSFVDKKGVSHVSDNASLVCEEANGRLRYDLRSEYCEGTLSTTIELPDLLASAGRQLANHFPALLPGPANKRTYSYRDGEANLHVRLYSGQLLTELFGGEVVLDSPVDITARMNGADNRSTVTVNAPRLSYNDGRYDNSGLYFSCGADSVRGTLMTTKYFNDSPVRVESRFSGLADVLNNELMWRKTGGVTTSGSLNTTTLFARNEDNTIFVDTKILPSDFYIADTLWQFSPATVSYGNSGFKINELRIGRQDQYVDVNIDFGKSAREMLIKLNDVEVAYLLGLTGFDPVEFSGRANGVVRNLPGSKNVEADLLVRNFCFNTGEMGELKAKSLFDSEEKVIYIDAKSQNTPEDSTLIKGNVNLAQNTLDINIKSEKTNLQFLNKYVKNFISDLEGTTSGNLRLFGDMKYVNMEADNCINYLKFRPTILGTMYSFENDSLHIRPDTIDFSGMTIRDSYGNTAKLKGSLNHHSLFNFSYGFDFLLDNFQLINWEKAPSRVYWGNIFASGNIGINGTFSRVNLSGELSPSGSQGTSVLYYNPESTETSEEEKQYVHFVTPEQKNSNSSSVMTTVPVVKDNSTDIYMDFKFNVNPNLTLNIITDPLTNDNMSLYGHGPIRLTYYNKGKFDLNGQYNIVGGDYKLTIKDIIRRNFVVEPGGYLRFSGNPSDGELNIKGIHKINSVSLSDLNVGASRSNSTVGADCILYFTGKASDPKVSFGLDFPSANPDENQIIKNIILTEEDRNMQAIYLLSIGRFYTYDYDSFNANGQSQSSVAMTSFLAGTLSGQINSLLQDAFHVENWNFDTKIAAGRMGLDDMEVQGSLSGRMFNNRLLFNGNIGYRDQMTTYSNNFVGNFNLQWFLNKSGSISLKAYSETNDRYFTKASLTTQGGGIMFKKDFNRLRFFFKRFKPSLR